MGRRRRLHRQAVIEGRVRSWKAARGDLRRHMVRLAIPLLFNDLTLGEKVDPLDQELADALVSVLPAACLCAGVDRFHIRDITRDKEWMKLCEGMVSGVLAHAQDTFGMVGRKGVWKLKKRQGRTRTGRWGFCGWDGTPIYITGSNKAQLYCSRRCYWAAYRTGEAPRRRRPTGYEIEEAVIQEAMKKEVVSV